MESQTKGVTGREHDAGTEQDSRTEHTYSQNNKEQRQTIDTKMDERVKRRRKRKRKKKACFNEGETEECWLVGQAGVRRKQEKQEQEEKKS